ncbi:MAG TPA: AraC family transcriptional regulator [Actinomycetota bacterium]
MPSRPEGEWVKAWKPSVPGLSEVFHARFVHHTYPKHTHETWTVFTVDDGAIRYDLEMRHRGVGRALVTVLPPHVVHDGKPASEAGFRKRVLYVDTGVLGTHLIGRAVDRPDIDDRTLLRALRHLHRSLGTHGDALEAESLMSIVAENLRMHLGDAPTDPAPIDERAAASALRDLLDTHMFETFTLAEASTVIGTSATGLVRSFTRAFGIAPHQHVIARRIEVARKRLLDGEPVATVAVAVGFHDQAHLTRHFKRHVGTTPARFAASASRSGSR